MSTSSSPPHLKSKKLFAIYVKPGCPHSSAAVKLLTENGFAPPKYVDVFALNSAEDLQRMTKEKTFPQVYLKQKHLIGGHDKLVTFFRNYNATVDDDFSSGEESDGSGSVSGSGSDA